MNDSYYLAKKKLENDIKELAKLKHKYIAIRNATNVIITDKKIRRKYEKNFKYILLKIDRVIYEIQVGISKLKK